MKIGYRICITRDYYGQRDGGSLIGRTGTIRRHEPGLKSHPGGLRWDVELDDTLPDGRRFLWFSTCELKTDAAAVTSGAIRG